MGASAVEGAVQTDVVTSQPSASAPASDPKASRKTTRPRPTATRSSLNRGGAAARRGNVASDIAEPRPNTGDHRLLIESFYRLLVKESIGLTRKIRNSRDISF